MVFWGLCCHLTWSVASEGRSNAVVLKILEQQGGISPFHQSGAGIVDFSYGRQPFLVEQDLIGVRLDGVPSGSSATSQRNARWFSPNPRPKTCLTLAVISQISGHPISAVKSSDIRYGNFPKRYSKERGEGHFFSEIFTSPKKM